MRLHSDSITRTDLDDAMRAAGLDPHWNLTAEPRRSRSRGNAWDVHMTGTSSRPPGFGRGEPGDKAATWDEWGMFLAHLFKVDPEMWAGTSVPNPTYQDAEDFHAITHNRFRHLTPDVQHGGSGHKWEVTVPGHTMECVGRNACGATAEQWMATRDRRRVNY